MGLSRADPALALLHDQRATGGQSHQSHQQHPSPSPASSARRSLIPAASQPRAGHPAQGIAPGVQQVQGGGWTREALVVLRLFHGQLHRGASTATTCESSATTLSVTSL
jgi:hypothetical protein